jgi:2,3-bisphosphoglycerate-independent phosphoglycerate mutase
MNLVSLAGEGPGLVMADYSGGHPTKDEQTAALEALNREFADPSIRLVPGVSFRNLLILAGFDGKPDLKPPHDHAGAKIAGILPVGPGAETLIGLQERSMKALAGLPMNKGRKVPINGVWFWGMGRAAAMPGFQKRHGKTGAVITGVDLVRGLGRLLEMEIVEVPGATGYVDTNFEGKAAAAIKALERVDFVFLHVEAPDEAGHEGDLDLKVQAITDFDHRTVKPALEGLRRFPDYRVLLLPDHETPVKERGHRGGPVPFAVAGKAELEGPSGATRPFSEKAAREAAREAIDAPSLLETRLFSDTLRG